MSGTGASPPPGAAADTRHQAAGGDPTPATGAARGAPDRESHESPPVLVSWRRVYALVLGWLALVIALLWWLTRAFT